MRIRTQLIAAATLAAVVAVAVGAGLAHVTRRATTGFEEQADSQRVARGVANMLSLTNEFTVFGGERVATQWRSHHAQLRSAVDDTLRRHDPPSPDLLELQRNIDDLPKIFDKLVQIGQEPLTPLAQRRRELLLERLLAESQDVLEKRYRWAVAIAEAQHRDQQLYTAMVLLGPAALLLLLVALGVLVWRGVLTPLLQLQTAVAAMQRGDLDVRCDNQARNELGDTARAVDAMAMSLQQQSTALRLSARRLRLLTDSIPALIGHVDCDERYTFVNACFGDLAAGPAEEMPGRTLKDVHGEAVYATLGPHVELALTGTKVIFETSRLLNGSMLYRESSYVPDIDESGEVRGFYALGFDVTERKEAELRRAASERLLANVTDNIPALVSYIDRDHRYRFANSKYRDWMGVEPQTMIGRHVRDAMGPTFYEQVRHRIEAGLAGETVRMEGRRLTDGEHRYHFATHTPDFGPDGEVRGCFVLSVDITERRDAELAIARSEQRLLDLTNSIPATVAYFDMAQRCQYVNESGLRTQGIEPTDVPGITLRAVLGEADYAQHEPYVAQVLEGRRARLEGKIPFSGREAHYQAHLIPDRVDGGEQRGFYLMTFDITALKEAEQQQARVERQLRGITDNLPVLISYVDRDERFTFLNATFQSWLGIDPQANLGRRVAEVLTPADYEGRRVMFRRAFAGERVEFDIDTQTSAGTKQLHNACIPDIQPDGTVLGFYTLGTDVTAMKQIERQLNLLARVDSLTLLPNRRQFEERLTEGVSRAARARRPIALMFLDIDHFKSINDTHGHAAGDAVLKEFAARLKRSVRVTDTPARLAGDEFVVMIEGVQSKSEAALVAQKVVTAMRLPFHVGGESLLVTTSLGVAFCQRPGPHTALMECADEALYHAKGAGRDTFTMNSMEPVITGFGELQVVPQLAAG